MGVVVYVLLSMPMLTACNHLDGRRARQHDRFVSLGVLSHGLLRGSLQGPFQACRRVVHNLKAAFAFVGFWALLMLLRFETLAAALAQSADFIVDGCGWASIWRLLGFVGRFVLLTEWATATADMTV